MKRIAWVALLGLLLLPLAAFGQLPAPNYKRISIPASCHPAVRAAARMMARKLAIPESAIQSVKEPGLPGQQEILLMVAPATPVQVKFLGSTTNGLRDGYAVAYTGGGALVYGARPRSLLFAAGDVHQWKEETSGTFIRVPYFAIRSGAYDGTRPVAEFVAALGINQVIGQTGASVTFKQELPEIYKLLSPEDQKGLDQQSRAHAEASIKFRQECRDADVDYYTFLYGSSFQRWSPLLYKALLKAYPSVEGKNAPAAFEKAWLCPSDPMTWRIVGAYLKEFTEQTQADGVLVTFWDTYGFNCQCDRCVKNGLNKFPNQLYEGVKHYYETLTSLKKKLIVRTWSSGVPHWLGQEFVHAPGYDHFSGSGIDLWSRVIKELPADIALQPKVYHSDCQPDARFSALLGNAQPHSEIGEYQITGQTTGRFYFPTSMVDHTAGSMKKLLDAIGFAGFAPRNGGVNIFPGGPLSGATGQSNYSLMDDIANGINMYAWRELSWNPFADLDRIWLDWATPIYGERAAPKIVRALRLSEEAVDRSFSTLGMGSDTNSSFPGNIARRETLLMYTNRHYLPEYARNLEPTKENIQRVIDEKLEALRKVDEMFRELEDAKPSLRKEQFDELSTRFDWLRQLAITNRYLEESYWRFRYLRHLSEMRTSDPEQMKYMAEAYDKVKEQQPKLFRYEDQQKFSCHSTNLGALKTKPSLGSPLPLMKELYEKSKAYVEEIVGPDYLSAEWKR